MNIENLDLSGLTGTIKYSNDFEIVRIVTDAAFSIVIILITIMFLVWFIRLVLPASKRYRELLTNLYVAGTIKKIAEQDGIDLIKEMKEYCSVIKKADNLNKKALDNIVERELNQEITERFEKSKEQIKEKK